MTNGNKAIPGEGAVTMKKERKLAWLRYLALYTGLWFALALWLYLIFLNNGKSFLWVHDGVNQHYAAFNYLCDYLEAALEHRPAGIFNFRLGQGLDAITTLDSYDLTDPVSVIAALLLPLSRLRRYTLMVFAKLYLIGVSFALYADAAEYKNKTAVVLAAVAYTFSGSILFTFARHPNYINWAYYLPLLLAGVELYTRKGKRAPLVLFVFLNAVTNFYTFYINAVLVVICVTVKLLCRTLQTRSAAVFKAEFIGALRTAGVCLVGVLLSLCILLPTIFAFAANSRVAAASGYTDSLWHYPWDYYGKLVESVFAAHYDAGNYYSFLGLNAALLIPVTMLLARKKGDPFPKAILIVVFLMLCLPFAGRLMNGFGYATNRWAYAVSFFAGLALLEMYDGMEKPSAGERAVVYITAVSYIAFCLLHLSTNGRIGKLYAVPMVLWAVVVWGIAVHFKAPRFNAVMACLVLAGAAFQIGFTFLPTTENYVDTFLGRGSAGTCFSNYSSTAAAGIDDGFYRVEEAESSVCKAGYSQVSTASVWWSLLPSTMYDYYRELGLETVIQNCQFRGLSDRVGLMELASVKYYTRPAAKEGLVPYGYEEVASPDAVYQVYKNKYALPIGYSYAGYIPRAEYDRLNALEKEQALLQGAVLEERPDAFDRAAVEYATERLSYDVVNTNGVELTGDRIVVKKGQGTVTLSVRVPANSEIYLYLDGFQLPESLSKTTITVTRSKDEFSVSKAVPVTSRNDKWAVIRDAVAVSLGSGYEGENTVTLKFSRASEYSVKDVSFYAVPMDLYEKNAASLKAYALEDAVVEADRVTGTVSLPEPRIMQFSIPYSKGWRALVDGVETDIVPSDVMYMAVFLDAGEHTVELRYATPYLKEGCAASGVTLLCWLGYELWQRRKKRPVRSAQGQ